MLAGLAYMFSCPYTPHTYIQKVTNLGMRDELVAVRRTHRDPMGSYL